MSSFYSEVAEKALSLLLNGSVASELPVPEQLRNPGKQAKRLLSALSTFNDHVLNRVAKLQNLQNLRAPISRLPFEILADIFRDVAKQSDYEDWYRVAMNLATVSRWWYSTVTADPKLWTHLYDRERSEVTRLKLKRSRNSPLHLYISNDYNAGPFLDLLVPHISRWKSFIASSELDFATVSKFLSQKRIPVLECLSIIHEPDSEHPNTSLNIFAPSLKVLEFTDCPFPLNLQHRTQQNITEIQFSAFIGDTLLSSEQFGHILSSSPNLETVHIHSGEQWADSAPSVTLFNVYLPKLRRLTLRDLPSHITGSLISSISTATDRYPLVEIDGIEIWNSSITFPDVPAPNTLLPAIRTSSWSTVQFDDTDPDDERFIVKVGVELSGVKKTLLETRTIGTTELLEDIFQGLFRERWCPRPSVVDLIGPSPFDIMFLKFAPSLDVLRIRVTEEDSQHESLEAIDSLSSGYSLGGGVRTWLCPHLSHIVLDTWVDLGDLMVMIRARESDTVSQEDFHEIPTKLKRIDITSSVKLKDDHHWEDFKQLIAEKNIVLRRYNMSDW